MTQWHMSIVCWIPKGTNPHSEYIIQIAFPAQQWFTKVPQYYVIRTMTVFFTIKLAERTEIKNFMSCSCISVSIKQNTTYVTKFNLAIYAKPE
jgi:hypothetical protein